MRHLLKLTRFTTSSRIPPRRALFRRDNHPLPSTRVFPQQTISVPNKEARVILAIEAIQSSSKLSRRATAKIYNVPELTLRDRINGRPTVMEYRPVSPSGPLSFWLPNILYQCCPSGPRIYAAHLELYSFSRSVTTLRTTKNPTFSALGPSMVERVSPCV
jgi:hypothetical protein